MFKKEHSREYSLFRIDAWYASMTKELSEILGQRITKKGACAVYTGGDLVDIYYKPSFLKIIFLKIILKFTLTQIIKKFQGINYLEQEVEKFLSLFRKLKPYFDESKQPKNIQELREIQKLYSRYWAYVAIMFTIPKLPVGKKLKKIAFEAREETQEYNESMEMVVGDFLKKQYPELKQRGRFLLPAEVWSGDVKMASIKGKINEREKGFVFYQGEIYSGDDFGACLSRLGIRTDNKKLDSQPNILKGQIAQKGMAKGIVRIISSVDHLDKVNKGDILVAAMTMPKYLPAMKKAAAFVTDEGGITCHAAIIAREMGKPCVIGTKVATEVLKDGDEVVVDANKGVIKIIKRVSKI